MLLPLYLRLLAGLCLAYAGFLIGRRVERVDQARRRERREAGRLLGVRP